MTQPLREPGRGTALIEAERARHAGLGYTPDHDRDHVNGELLAAATTYIAFADPVNLDPNGDILITTWPFEPGAFHPTGDVVLDLAKAGGFIAAEIDRILAERAEEPA